MGKVSRKYLGGGVVARYTHDVGEIELFDRTFPEQVPIVLTPERIAALKAFLNEITQPQEGHDDTSRSD